MNAYPGFVDAEKTWSPVSEDDRIHLHEDRLDKPLRWREPTTVSVGEIFHPDVPFEFLDKTFAVIAMADQHTFEILTRHPERMREYIESRRQQLEEDFFECELGKRVNQVSRWLGHPIWMNARLSLTSTTGRYVPPGEEHLMSPENPIGFPTPNAWLGVRVEDQATANERLPHLLATPAAIRYARCEPLAGPIDLTRLDLGVQTTRGYGPRRIYWDALTGWEEQCKPDQTLDHEEYGRLANTNPQRTLHWVTTGGSTSPDARPLHPDWVRALRDHCLQAGVPFTFRGWGAWAPSEMDDATHWIAPDGTSGAWEDGEPNAPRVANVRPARSATTRTLDGREWDEKPDSPGRKRPKAVRA